MGKKAYILNQDRLRHYTHRLRGENMATTAQAKPRATETAPGRIEVTAHVEERIRERAYELYLLRGGAPGLELEDWCRAEQEIVQPEQTPG